MTLPNPLPLPPDGIAPSSAEAGVPSKEAAASLTERVLKIHGALSELVAPATALTLRTTQPATTGRTMFDRMPPVVKFSAYAAIVSGLIFGASAAVIAAETSGKKTAPQTAPTPVASSQAKAAK
jgi:hypothetical protein